MSEQEPGFGYALSGKELRRVIAATPEDRLAYFVDKCNEFGQVWTVGAGEELVVLADDEDVPFVVVFPHPEFAQDWFSSTDLDDVDLVAIGTGDWTDELLPGLQEAEIGIVVSPTSESPGAHLQPLELAALMTSGE